MLNLIPAYEIFETENGYVVHINRQNDSPEFLMPGFSMEAAKEIAKSVTEGDTDEVMQRIKKQMKEEKIMPPKNNRDWHICDTMNEALEAIQKLHMESLL